MLRYAVDSRTFFSCLATLRACSALLPTAKVGRYRKNQPACNCVVYRNLLSHKSHVAAPRALRDCRGVVGVCWCCWNL
jgi:hypothetical protein